MDTLDQYHEIISDVLQEISKQVQSPQIEALISIDRTRGQYILMVDGWEGNKRYYTSLVHIDLKTNAEVWLRCDNTDIEVGQMLIAKGIDAKNIVPAFYSPKMRQYAQSI
jgi:hypothetical protein